MTQDVESFGQFGVTCDDAPTVTNTSQWLEWRKAEYGDVGKCPDRFTMIVGPGCERGILHKLQAIGVGECA